MNRVRSIQGTLRPPSDKSLTHRAYMFSAIAEGPSAISAPLRSEDCDHTLACLGQLGVAHRDDPDGIRRIYPPSEWHSPSDLLDCGNSGTTMRLLSGLIASRPIAATMIGDESLSRRPMRRIAEPLRLMGAHVLGDTPPLTIHGSRLQAIHYQSPVSSAQVKSCILLAGLRAEGTTEVREPSLSRDHTERMLSALGADVRSLAADGESMSRLIPGGKLSGFEFKVPADISSAAFFVVAACLVGDSRLEIKDLGVNPTRTGLLDILDQIGAVYPVGNPREELNEPVADVEITRPPTLKPFQISGSLVPRLIDEIPVLSVLATQCEGTSTIRDASELRVKESDRIELIAQNLRSMGAKVETHPDGLSIEGPVNLKGAEIKTKGDHRIAMAFAIAGLVAEGRTVIHGAESIATSYPDFQEDLERVCVV